MQDFTQHIIRLYSELHPLDRVARAGYVLRGVAEPESVAAHSHFVALLAMLYADRNPDVFDASKAVAMALIHDLAECRLMDIPMPAADAHFKELKAEAEQAVTEQLFESIDRRYGELHRELCEGTTPEARLVRGLDKAQMMIKVLMYQREGRGRLHEFWTNPANFNDYGLTCVSDLFDAICLEAGRPRPSR
ncbi:MAG: hypothetical protein AMXMBFR84_48770 [Candidatus Hydrogenedentota bacterium]